MMSKIIILAIFAICAIQAAPAPGLLASAVVAPYASTYNAHTVNHAISAPLIAAPAAYSPYIAAPAAYSAIPAAYSAYATGYPTAYSAGFPTAYSAGFPAAYSALPASYVL